MPKSVYTNQYTILRRSLIDARKTAGLTQQDLATILSKPQSYVSKFESGERRIDVIEFIMISKAIGVDPIEIIRIVTNSFSIQGDHLGI